MDLQICSACSSPTPAGSSIKLKTCQHSFCVLCLKYALIFGGAPNLQCPYPQGTFECGAKPNEAEVQYILEYEEEDRQGVENDQDGGEKNDAIEELEKTLDRVLSIDVDEFPGEPTEELPSAEQLLLNGGDASKDDTSTNMNDFESVMENSEDKLAVNQCNPLLDNTELNEKCSSDVDIISSSGSDELLWLNSNDETIFSPDNGSDLLQGTKPNDVEKDDTIKTEPNQPTIDEIPTVFNAPNEALEVSEESKRDSNNIELPTLSSRDSESFLSEQESTETEKAEGESTALGVDNDIRTNAAESSPNMEYADSSVTTETDISGESSTIVKDVSKGAIPKVSKIHPNPSEDQDLALALKLQEEESKLDLDLLLAVSDANLPPNMESFECPVCYGQFKPYEGVTLAYCFHSFCKPCLAESVKHSDELEVTCPALADGNVKCSAIIQDGAIRDLLTEEDFGRFQDRCLQTAEAVIPNTFHCLTPNCRGWVELIGEVEFFDCSICSVENCVSCKAIHGNQSCEDYRATIQKKDDDIKSEATLKTMVETREGMRCPKCGVMITKIAGCDFMTCTTCKTGICWPTRGPRWGPAGQGDISGGCRCKVDNGKRCHPECEGCH